MENSSKTWISVLFLQHKITDVFIKQHGVLMDYFELVDFSICKSAEGEYYFESETVVFSQTHFIISFCFKYNRAIHFAAMAFNIW